METLRRTPFPGSAKGEVAKCALPATCWDSASHSGTRSGKPRDTDRCGTKELAKGASKKDTKSHVRNVAQDVHTGAGTGNSWISSGKIRDGPTRGDTCGP